MQEGTLLMLNKTWASAREYERPMRCRCYCSVSEKTKVHEKTYPMKIPVFLLELKLRTLVCNIFTIWNKLNRDIKLYPFMQETPQEIKDFDKQNRIRLKDIVRVS